MIKASSHFPPSHPARQQLVSIGQLAEATGYCRTSLLNFCREGRIPSYRSGPGGHRRFPLSECLEALGIKREDQPGSEAQSIPVALLARVSGAKQGVGFDTAKGESRDGQDSDLSRQVERLREYAKEKYGVENPRLFADVGSGLSFNRKNFQKLVRSILAGEFRGGVLLLTYKDRACRWGFELLEQICEFGEVRIEFCESEPDKSDESEMMTDLFSILHVFSCKSYSKRAAQRTTKRINGIERALELQKEGLPVSAITKILDEEGYRSIDGRGQESKLTRFQVSKYLKNDLVKQVVLNPDEESNLERFWRENVDYRPESNPNARTSFADLYRRFTQWAAVNGCRKLTQYTVSNFIRSKGVLRKMNSGRIRYCGMRLV